MAAGNFKLYPFTPDDRLSGLDVTGQITRNGNTLSILFVLSGDLNLIKIPEPEYKPIRKNCLWENTCLELFLGVEETTPYWEFNFSPSGNWNVYRFNSYRTGMADETAFSVLPFRVTRHPYSLEISVGINIEKLMPGDRLIRAGVSAVVRTFDDHISYWALAHPGTKPDFHLNDAFLIEL